MLISVLLQMTSHFQGTCHAEHQANAMKIISALGHESLQSCASADLRACIKGMVGDSSGPKIDIVSDMFASLHKGMHVKELVMETKQVDGTYQKHPVMNSIYDILKHCANSEGKGECHAGCPYHDESLIVHLIVSAIFAAISALYNSPELAYPAFVTALLHDCGKPSSKKGGEGLCPQHWHSAVSYPCNHKGHGQCQHHCDCSHTNTAVQPPPNWFPFVAGTNILNTIKCVLTDIKCTESITEPPEGTPPWEIPILVKAQIPPNFHEEYVRMLKMHYRPCDCARYPGHGLLGAICFAVFYEAIYGTMPETMTHVDKIATLDAMARTVQIHMALHNCGNTEVCHQVLAHENHLVRNLASHMYVGDNLGKIRSEAYQEKVPFNEAYVQFIANMESLPDPTSLVALKPGKKATILLMGQSGSGKSSSSRSLHAYLPTCHRVEYISRDEILTSVITGRLDRLSGEPYALMYAIYNACRSYHKDSSKDLTKVHSAITNAQAKGLQLTPIFTNVTEQNVPDIKKLVDTALTEAYNKALDNKDVDVIVVDSCFTLWETALQQHIPRLSETIVIGVPVINFAGIVSKENGLSEEEQLRLSGSNSLYNPCDGVFASPHFDPYGKNERSYIHQAPPVILTTKDGVISVDNSATMKWIASALGDQPIIHPPRVDTSSMNACEFIQHLVDKHDRDMLKVRDELFNTINGWDVTMNGMYHYDGKTSITKKARMIGELLKFCSILKDMGILKKPITEEELDSDDQLFWNIAMSISVVKYKDGHNGSKFWVNEFMRHFRGITIFTHPITGKVTVLRYLMDRGAEIHSKVTNKKVKGQDDGDTNGVDLDNMSKCLLKDLKLEGYLTQKADGSLGAITVYSGMALKIMKAYIETYGTDVAKVVANKSLEMTQGKFMVVLATQGTKSLSEDMTSFATTSIFGGIRDKEGTPLVSRSEMSTNTPLEIWQKHGSKVLKRVFAVHDPAYAKYPDDSITLMFEMLCAKNRDAFPGGKFHDEFACNATKDQFLFLGLGYASLEVNIPHCVIDINGAFQQPVFWKIENGEQVSNMIRDLQQVMRKSMTIEVFLEVYPPMNPEEFDELHPEGFVLFGYVSSETTPIHMAYGLPGILTYAKVKTLDYYMAHKFKVENLEALVRCGHEAPGQFPLCDKLFSIYSSGELQKMLTQVHGEYKNMFDMSNKESALRLAIAKLDIEQKGKFKMDPIQLYNKMCQDERSSNDPLSSFIKAIVNDKSKKSKSPQESSLKDDTLSKIVADMLTGILIRSWNKTFGTSIQTLEDVSCLEKEGAKLALSPKARGLHNERIMLARKYLSALMQTIKEAMPWNDDWQKVATCTNVPELLKNNLIEQMVDLHNKPLVCLPTSNGG
jgi:hypothetical protein